MASDRYTAAGDEAGTAPGDRSFRPDVQGLRAVAILLVVLYHGDIPGFSGGYVGVDVFFVISGFVITGLLLRERESTGSTSIASFYARRVRRILPAASLVIIVTVVAAFVYLGSITGHDTAVDGIWAALFVANFHFATAGTNYLASQKPPSALQNFWSLAVEEQFYIVYPTVFLVTARLLTRFSLRVRLTVVLLAIIAASFSYSVVLTSSNAPVAFFSPLTRAWELALGGLIAVAGTSLRRMPRTTAALLSWVGLVAIVTAGLTLTSTSVYPGALVAIPVLGAGLIIAAGTAQPAWGAEQLLRRKPFQLLGLISYSLYLWHWPILIIATQRRGTSSLPTWDNVLLLLIATVAAVVTYVVLENPVRHSRFLVRRRWVSIGAGCCLIALTLVVTTLEQQRPVVSLGSLTTATTGSKCNPAPPTTVENLRSSYQSTVLPGQRPPKEPTQSVVVIGDSTACTLLPGLQAVGPSYGLAFENGAVIGCGVVSGTLPPMTYFTNSYSKLCQAQANRVEAEAIEQYRPKIIVWGSTQERNSFVVKSAHGSKVLESGSAPWHAAMLARMNIRVEHFIAIGAKVILLLEPPEVHPGNQPDSDDAAFGRMNALLREIAALHPGHVAAVDLEERVCPSGPPCPEVVDGFNPKPTAAGDVVRPDGFHYLPAGALWVAEWLVPRIEAAAKKLS